MVSEASYSDFKLTGKVFIDKTRHGEFQFRGLTYGLSFTDKGVWKDLEVVAKGDTITFTLERDAASREPDLPQEMQRVFRTRPELRERVDGLDRLLQARTRMQPARGVERERDGNGQSATRRGASDS